VRNLKKHLEKVYRKSAFKLVQRGAKLVAADEPPPAAAEQPQAADAAGADGAAAAAGSSSSAATQADEAAATSSSVTTGGGDDSSSSSSSNSSSSSSGSGGTAGGGSTAASGGGLRVVYTGEPVTIGADQLKEFVGLPPFAQDKFYDSTPTGVVMGLAWTAMGGATLYVEAAPIIEVRGQGGACCVV
jgi:Lon-like ATP-dependent protease